MLRVCTRFQMQLGRPLASEPLERMQTAEIRIETVSNDVSRWMYIARFRGLLAVIGNLIRLLPSASTPTTSPTILTQLPSDLTLFLWFTECH